MKESFARASLCTYNKYLLNWVLGLQVQIRQSVCKEFSLEGEIHRGVLMTDCGSWGKFPNLVKGEGQLGFPEISGRRDSSAEC